MKLKKMATHNGSFHTDEVVAYIILKEIFPDSFLIRTRDIEEIKSCDIVFDVGGIYNADENRFDHHFNDERLIRKSSGIKYSSAGLIWKHYGKVFLETKFKKFNKNEIQKLWKTIDERIFEWIDNVDNSLSNNVQMPKNCITINHMINSFRPNWNSNKSTDEGFNDCINWTKIWLFNEIQKFVGQLEGEKLVIKDFENRPFDRILVMDKFKPWQQTIFEKNISNNLDYIVYYDDINNNWMIQCVPIEKGSFFLKKPLPKEWINLTKEKLSTLVGVEMIFCHPNRFIGGFKNKEDLPKIVDIICK